MWCSSVGRSEDVACSALATHSFAPDRTSMSEETSTPDVGETRVRATRTFITASALARCLKLRGLSFSRHAFAALGGRLGGGNPGLFFHHMPAPWLRDGSPRGLGTSMPRRPCLTSPKRRASQRPHQFISPSLMAPRCPADTAAPATPWQTRPSAYVSYTSVAYWSPPTITNNPRTRTPWWVSRSHAVGLLTENVGGPPAKISL